MTSVSPQTSFTAKTDIGKKAVFRLRAHQMLCLMTWKGIAFTPDFVRVFNMLVDYIRSDRAVIEILDRPDTLKEEPENLVRGRNEPPPRPMPHRDRLAMDELGRHTGLPMTEGTMIIPEEPFMDHLRAKFKAGDIRGACAGCRFDDMCTRIAKEDFRDSRLMQPLPRI